MSHLAQQRKALAKKLSAIAMVTLLPANLALPDITNVSWAYVAELLEQSVSQLRQVLPDDDYRRGYELIATELLDRIRSHPNNITS